MNQDIRWKQRFKNFDRALGLLQEALAGVKKTSPPWNKKGPRKDWNTRSSLHGNA